MKDHNLTITNQILSMITKSGELPWNRPWNMVNGLSATNFNSGRVYTGYFNQMILQFSANGKLPLFTPFSKDHPTMKGEKATFIWRPLISKKVDEKTHEEKSALLDLPRFRFSIIPNVMASILKPWKKNMLHNPPKQSTSTLSRIAKMF